MGKNKSTKTDGADQGIRNQELKDQKRIAKGYYKKAPQSPK
ncbi:hypothetical protein Sgly_1666 [Syntrophobotulus glycolicus DSM 8271]|uniref:Uncharacterized protein n=1 Tax=Syntrophobotulus glycolicus (strain DSM 8271 / FlGlyR) TaxID=645991 RepID=F0SYC9_SYNGF|nr:hypothetical protein [Syntrophobotulus glycolicus]ADY55964.1 hypothetical protein Sgly_1666 [Syntrophobotulus glycolicus DSM 8271]